MTIPVSRLDLIFRAYQEEFELKALSVLHSGCYLLREESRLFERDF